MYQEIRIYHHKPSPVGGHRVTKLLMTASGPQGRNEDWTYEVITQLTFGKPEYMYHGNSYLLATRKVCELLGTNVIPNADDLEIMWQQ